MKRVNEIVKLLWGRKTGMLSGEEERQLQEWMEKEGNRRMAERVLSEEGEREALGAYRRYDVERAYARFVARVGGRKERSMRVRRWMWAAAGLALLVCGSVWLVGQKAILPGVEEEIVPVTGKAILVLGNGEEVALGRDRALYERDTNGMYVLGDSARLVYRERAGEEKAEEVQLVYNKLLVPRGGEYALQLSDSTRIWVNSESALRYPETFGADVRVVDLEGEAYFAVAKDSARPFIVRTGGMELRVLGTEFNVASYRDEALTTTLVSGRVALAAGQAAVVLEPGEQAVLSSDGFSKQRVDVQRVTAWKDGVVAFEDERLGDLMDKLCRWYDIQVFYQNPGLQDVRITGYINRYKDIRILLDKLEMLDLAEFEVRGRTITVREKS